MNFETPSANKEVDAPTALGVGKVAFAENRLLCENGYSHVTGAIGAAGAQEFYTLKAGGSNPSSPTMELQARSCMLLAFSLVQTPARQLSQCGSNYACNPRTTNRSADSVRGRF